MKTFRLACLCGALVCALSSLISISLPAAEAVVPTAPLSLFNGRDLEGWTVVGRDGDPAAADTWTVSDGVLKASGQPYGYVRTKGAYRDYILRIEWRWVAGPAPTDANGKPRGRNSGVLLHIQGEDKVWPTCLEAQLQERFAGDFIAMDMAVVFDELTAMREKAAAEAGTDTAARERALGARRITRRHESSEKPIGEWNTYEIICRADTVTLVVNGVLQNSATGLSISEGAIGLQSEGMPIEFRRVDLTALPAP